MDYKQALEELYSMKEWKFRLGLKNMKALLRKLENPFWVFETSKITRKALLFCDTENPDFLVFSIFVGFCFALFDFNIWKT